MTHLNDQVAIVTGASSGIGEATSKSLAQAGAKVVLAARRVDRIEKLASEIKDSGGEALPVGCDVSLQSDVENLAQSALSNFGRIDILINNAGIMPLAPLAKRRVGDWDACIDVNIKGVLYGIDAVLPTMLQQKTGHIINISSVAGRVVIPRGAVYCATKFAVNVISDGLRSELAEMSREDGNRIRVTVVAPGVVKTELPDSIRDEETRAASQAYYDSIPGPLQSEDIAAAIMFAVQSPEHVGVNDLLIRPTAQVR